MAEYTSCNLTVVLNNKKKIRWSGENGATPLFSVPKHAEDQLKSIHSIEDLIHFIHGCIANTGMELAQAIDIYDSQCSRFDKQLRAVDSFEKVSSLSLAWGEYDPSEGSPEDACLGQSVSYDFKTGKCKISRQADTAFINEVCDVFGDVF